IYFTNLIILKNYTIFCLKYLFCSVPPGEKGEKCQALYLLTYWCEERARKMRGNPWQKTAARDFQKVPGTSLNWHFTKLK
ncbi:hypothetical protein, partial [Desulforamulus profundi]|uniref:hypothetical protein n=1 Tax=Desulforamulus profundi TaxID=1383067 RepID=UPI001A9A2FC9